ncbi:MAG: CvpA family protein [Betaproteobacteria bacterium]|nr:CvpA family protein [Betaproteobacteria bacterium]
MTWFDYGVFIVLGLSLLLSLLRGLIREVVSLAGWITAFVLSIMFSGNVAAYLPASLGPMLAGLLAYLLVFAGILIATGFVGLILSILVRAAGLGLIDRLLGMAFGITRAVVIIVVAVMLAGLTPLPKELFWRNAVLSGPVETIVIALRPYLPGGLAERIKYRG